MKMKSFSILCFWFLATASIFSVTADEETKQVAVPRNDEQPEAVVTTEDEPELSEDGLGTNDEEDKEEEKEDDEENTNNEEDSDEEETEDDEDQSQELETDDEGKRGSKRPVCRKRYYGKKLCIRCCRRICKPKFCKKRYCKKSVCGKSRKCRRVTRYKLVKKYVKVNVGDLYYPKYVTRVVPYKVSYRVKVCKYVPKYCKKCQRRRYRCGRWCKKACAVKKCFYTPYPHASYVPGG